MVTALARDILPRDSPEVAVTSGALLQLDEQVAMAFASQLFPERGTVRNESPDDAPESL